MKRIFFTFFICLALSIMLFTSCESKKNVEDTGSDVKSGDITATAPEYFEFTIIRSDSSSSGVSDAAKALKSALENASGKKVKMGTDYEGLTKKTDLEILVGSTKRDESKQYADLGGKSYVIDYSSTRIVITGGSDNAIIEAVNYFIDNYLDKENGVITLKSGDKYEKIFEYPKLIVNGNDLNGYNFVQKITVYKELVDNFLSKINDTFGCRITKSENENDKSIVLEFDESLTNNSYKCYSDGTKIYLAASDETAAAVALSKLSDMIPESAKEGENVELTLNAKGTLPTSILDDILDGFAGVKYFKVDTDKEPLDYKVGETMHFDIELHSGSDVRSCPLFKWTVKCESGEDISGYSAGGTGKISFAPVMKNPGFVNIVLYACRADGSIIEEVNVCSAGAAAGYSDIKTVGTEPEDFDEFWKKQLERLDKVAPVASEMKRVSIGSDAYDVYDVKIDCLGDRSFTGDTFSAIMVSIPKGASPKSLKIYVNYMGAGVRSTETHLGYKKDSICIAVNGHSIESFLDESFYNQMKETKLKNYPNPKSADQDPSEIYYSYMVMRDLQAIRWAKAYFGENGENLWNGKDIDIHGTSEGGFQGIFSAALDSDVTTCTVDVPAICDQQKITIGRRSGYGPNDPQLLYYDCCFFARRIKCKMNVRVNLGDNTCPPSGITAMFHELNCEKKITFYQNLQHSCTFENGEIHEFFERTE